MNKDQTDQESPTGSAPSFTYFLLNEGEKLIQGDDFLASDHKWYPAENYDWKFPEAHFVRHKQVFRRKLRTDFEHPTSSASLQGGAQPKNKAGSGAQSLSGEIKSYEIVNLINQEIKIHKEKLTGCSFRSTDFEDGFLLGLEQTKTLIEIASKGTA